MQSLNTERFSVRVSDRLKYPLAQKLSLKVIGTLFCINFARIQRVKNEGDS
jgi:hypothetical protein